MTDNHFPEDPNPPLDDETGVPSLASPIDSSAQPEPTAQGTDEATDTEPVDTEPVDTEPVDTDTDTDTDTGQNDAGSEPDWEAAPPSGSNPTSTPPQPPVRRLRRANASSGPGVAAGIARYLGVETGLVKAAFVVASFFGGLGIFVYIAAWALIPAEHHPDPRPVVLNGSVAGIVIGTLAMVGAVSVAFGAGGAAGSLLAPALLIGIGFYLLDQRSTPQVATTHAGRPATRPSWIPPLTTTPLAPRESATYTSAYAAASTTGALNDDATDGSAPPWGSVLTEPPAPAKPKPPVTAVTMAATAVVVATLIGLDQLTGADVSVPQMFGAAVGIIVTGIIVSLFVGRALGLWFAGFIALIGWAVSPIAVEMSVDGVGSKQFTILNGSDLESSYGLGTGELIVDFRDARFTDDATTSIELGAGSIVVYLPDDVTVDLQANARFGQVIAPLVSDSGAISSATDEVSGPSSQVRRVYEDLEGAPTLSIDADVRFGSIEIRRG